MKVVMELYVMMDVLHFIIKKGMENLNVLKTVLLFQCFMMQIKALESAKINVQLMAIPIIFQKI